jgi:hypothetical protein
VLSPIKGPFARRALLCYGATAVGSVTITLVAVIGLKISILGGMFDFPLYLVATHLVLAPASWLLTRKFAQREAAV